MEYSLDVFSWGRCWSLVDKDNCCYWLYVYCYRGCRLVFWIVDFLERRYVVIDEKFVVGCFWCVVCGVVVKGVSDNLEFNIEKLFD